MLAPSPLALEKQVKEAGLESLEGLDDQKDRVAFHTGVVFAYTLLGGRTLPKPEFLAQLRSLRGGLATIGTGTGLLTASREDFLRELDAVVSSSVPEEGWGPNDTTGPLVQAERGSPA